MVTTPYTDKNLIEELNQQINPYIHRGFRDTYIIDGRKSGSLYKKILDWSVFIANNASKYSAFVRPKGIPIGPTAQQYEELLNDVTDTIFNQRKEITSFPYMLKQLFCNCGVALVTLFILAIVYSATVQAENTLLVGTTGDYPPLTYKVGANYVGSDIKVIQNFAKSNNMNIKYIPTSWQTLSSDLIDKKFMVAVGGISANPERSSYFYPSSAVSETHKVAMIKCSDISRFTSFATIDNEKISVVENRGGTNQEFALKHVKYAPILLVSNNFDALQIVSGVQNTKAHPYVMFTDNVEVDYHHQIDSLLCQAQIPEKFSSSDKVFLFAKTPEGLKLRDAFNKWLGEQKH